MPENTTVVMLNFLMDVALLVKRREDFGDNDLIVLSRKALSWIHEDPESTRKVVRSLDQDAG